MTGLRRAALLVGVVIVTVLVGTGGVALCMIAGILYPR